MDRSWLLTSLISLTILAVGCYMWAGGGEENPEENWVTLSPPEPRSSEVTFATPHQNPSGKLSDRFPDSTLVDQDGKEYRFYQDLVKDRIVVVQFMYTSCTGI